MAEDAALPHEDETSIGPHGRFALHIAALLKRHPFYIFSKRCGKSADRKQIEPSDVRNLSS